MILLQTQKRLRHVADISGAAEITFVTFPSRLSTSAALTELTRYSHKVNRVFPHLQATYSVIGIQYLPEDLDDAAMWSVGMIPIEDMCGQVESEAAEWADLGRTGPNSWDNDLRAEAGLPPLGDDQAAA